LDAVIKIQNHRIHR